MFCFYRKLLYVCLILALVTPLKGQEIQTKKLILPAFLADAAVPTSYVLANGARHLNLYAGTLGHPFLVSSTFSTGNHVIINGKKFDDITLNFDVHNMILIIQYDFDRLGKQRYIPPVNSVESFSIDGRKFVRFSYAPDGDVKFYEEIYSGYYGIYNLYSKKYEVNRNNLQQFEFSEVAKSTYVYYNNEFYRYRSNRGFVNSFPDEFQPEIKDYLRENKMNVRNISRTRMQEILKYINALD